MKPYLILSLLLHATCLVFGQLKDVNTSHLSKFSLKIEATGVLQGYPDFKKKTYNGPVSIISSGTTYFLSILTIPMRYKFSEQTWCDVAPEISIGNAIGNGAGSAAYPNGLYGFPSYKPFLFKAHVHYQINFDSTKNKLKKIHLSFGQYVPQEVLSMNHFASDPKRDFLNFATILPGAWDLSTTAYGYTYGFTSIFEFKKSALIFTSGTVNSTAGGNTTDWNVLKGNSFNLQYCKNFNLKNKLLCVRLTGFLNHTKGNYYTNAKTDSLGKAYFEANNSYTYKYGIALDLDYQLWKDGGLFLKASKNNGKTENWGYTEIDQSVCLGISKKLSFIKRSQDLIGIAINHNTISKEHATFLNKGGTGFMLGDGKLNYSPESILEVYYKLSLYNHFYLTLNYQYLTNIGFNKDRGNVSFYGLRLHIEY